MPRKPPAARFPVVRVLELGTMITAPYAAMMLANRASVIKIENRTAATRFAPTVTGHYGPNFVAYITQAQPDARSQERRRKSRLSQAVVERPTSWSKITGLV